MAIIKQYLVFILASTSFMYTFYVMSQLINFLSIPRKSSKIYTWVFNLLDNRARLEAAYGPIIFNTLYLILFIGQHSFIKSQLIKKLLNKLHLATAERAIYSSTSSLCLHFLVKNWSTASSILLWQIDVETHDWKWWSFITMHALAWVIICGGSMIEDLPEILGIKQAYYDLKNYGTPLTYRSLESRTFYNHIRHPSFTAFNIILWFTNLMTIDRLVLAILLTSYMYFAWSTDRNDVLYQKNQFERKKRELIR